ncbi:MAG: ABC transporter permease [Candidatus Uhrbacteria bacterium]|nr:ABC transporter permease [Patescibacteria group bacterium]MBU1906587.1 ABC transporter permease [Patescibacteria group bacterium]
MKIRDQMKLSLQSLLRNKGRSVLTMLGIVIGIGAVMLMLSIGKGAEGLILSEVAELGSDLVYVEPGSGDIETHTTAQVFAEKTLTYDDVKEIRKHGGFTSVAGILQSGYFVEKGSEEKYAQVVGITPEYIDIFPSDLSAGRYIEESDIDSNAKVVVLGSKIKDDLFGDQDPIGQKVKIKNVRFRVVGVHVTEGTRFFMNLDEQVYVPITSMQSSLMGVDYITYLAARTPLPLDYAKEEMRLILRDTHNIDNPEGDLTKDDFFVSTQEDAVAIIGTVSGVLTLLLSAIAAISLVVGGIGIMNIMLVSVTERTREIGLRKAVGATRGNIMRQFLTEAVLLTLFGGILGIVFGAAGSYLAAIIIRQFQSDWVFVFAYDAMIYATFVAVAVGLVFGIYPARRAAKLNPIEALRYE